MRLACGRDDQGGRLRYSGPRVAGAARQPVAALVRPCRRSAASLCIQRGRSPGRLFAAGARRSALEDSLSERRYGVRARIAAASGIFLRVSLAAGPRAPPHPNFRQHLCASGAGGYPAQRHASERRDRRADAHPRRSAQRAVGRGLEDHRRDIVLHQPHVVAGSIGELAGAVVRAPSPAASRNHLRDQCASPRGSEADWSTRPRSLDRDLADRRERRAPGQDGAPRLRRLTPGQRRFGAPYRADANQRVQAPAPALSGPHRQQD